MTKGVKDLQCVFMTPIKLSQSFFIRTHNADKLPLSPYIRNKYRKTKQVDHVESFCSVRRSRYLRKQIRMLRQQKPKQKLRQNSP